MARTPRNVLVFPFRRRADAGLEFAVFRRADDPGEFWLAERQPEGPT